MVYSMASDAGTPAAELDAVFAALAHQSRRELVVYLAGRATPPRMTQVAADNGLSPQLLNKHTAALEKAGLVRRERHGRERYLVLDPAALAAAQNWIHETRMFWSGQFDALDAYIATLKGDADD
jgi:DNA-binding MarR family transcriptional regulator